MNNPYLLTLMLAMGWLVILLVGGFALAVLGKVVTGKIDLTFLISGGPNRDASLSRFQFLIFTFVIAMCLFLVVVSGDKPALPAIPASILALLGISSGSYVVSKGVDAGMTTSGGGGNNPAAGGSPDAGGPGAAPGAGGAAAGGAAAGGAPGAGNI